MFGEFFSNFVIAFVMKSNRKRGQRAEGEVTFCFGWITILKSVPIDPITDNNQTCSGFSGSGHFNASVYNNYIAFNDHK